jgi:hypothetical protein
MEEEMYAPPASRNISDVVAAEVSQQSSWL